MTHRRATAGLRQYHRVGQDRADRPLFREQKPIGENVFVQLDVGAQSNLYCSDVSRAIPSHRKLNDRQTMLYGRFNHFVGLNVHDVGDRYQPLAPGMVIAIDSAMGIPDEELNFRIEDDLHITESGNEVLSKGIPRTIEEIESTFDMDAGK